MCACMFGALLELLNEIGEWCSENLIMPKVLYFLLNVLCYCVYTYTGIYFEKIWGISNYHFGYIIGICCIVSFVGSISWTMLADRTGLHRNIIMAATLGYFCSFALLWWAQGGRAGLSEASKLTMVAMCYGAANFFTSAMYPLLDHCMFVHLSHDVRFSKELFGRQRLFGTLGMSFITAVMGYTIDFYGFDSIFIALTISSILFLSSVGIGLPSLQVSLIQVDGRAEKARGEYEAPMAIERSTDPPPAEKETSSNPERHSILSPTWTLLKQGDYLFFLLIVLVAGTSRGVVGNYVTQYLEHTLHTPPKYMGIILQTRIITEVGIFFLGKHMLERIGVVWMMIIAQATGFLRVFSYAVIPSYFPWNLSPLLVELLKGINNACLISASVRYVHDVAPVGAETTAQGFFSGVHSFLANAASGFFGGAILQTYSQREDAYRILFGYTSILSMAGLVLYCIRGLIVRSKS